MVQKIYVFDAYGTLFDVHAAVRGLIDEIGEGGAELSAIWRTKQLEYSWVNALMDRYQSFWDLTQQALDFAFEAVPTANRSARQALLDAYFKLDAYPEVANVLTKLKEGGAKTAILSNGSVDMLSAAVSHAGLDDLLDAQLSVDALQTFKVKTKVYQMVLDTFGCQANDVAFQSSNRWDIAGASGFGFHCNWINRTGQPDEYKNLPPARVLTSLEALV